MSITFVAAPQPKKTFNRKERKGRKEEGSHHEGTKFTIIRGINIRALRVLRAFVVNPSFERLELLE